MSDAKGALALLDALPPARGRTHNQSMTVTAVQVAERNSASVVACGDPAPVLEAGEEVLGPVTLRFL